MKALTLTELKHPLTLVERADLQPAEGEVIVALRAAALNRRDQWITQGLYPGIKLPATLGSDGAGVVASIGDEVPHHWSQKQVIINPGWDWGDNPHVQSANFRILGMPDHGTFATEVAVPAKYLFPKPEHLDWHEAAALPLGGMTAYRAVFTQGALQANQRVLISGVGGGVATFALQFAVAAGATVLVTSSSASKLARARELGAIAGYDYTAAEWHKQLQAEQGPVDLIIDSAAGTGYAKLIEIAAPGGRIVNYGATTGAPEKLDMFKVFWKQLQLVGSTMGSPDDFQAMLELVNDKQIRPVIDQQFALADGQQALERFRSREKFGKIVLDTSA